MRLLKYNFNFRSLGSFAPVERGRVTHSTLFLERSHPLSPPIKKGHTTLYFTFRFTMSNIHLVAELMDTWLREENYALTARISMLEESLRAYRTANSMLTDRCNELRDTLEDQMSVTNTHVDLNFQMQERIEYLELLLARPYPSTRQSDMSFSSSSDED